LGSKIKDSNTFKLNFNCGYLSKLFEDFSNLKLLEFDLNNSNLKQYFKRKTFKMINQNKVWKFETKFKSFRKAKSTLGLEIKICMPWNVTYQTIKNLPISI
jgi:hypothetical protein